jgi:hypothetical protein
VTPGDVEPVPPEDLVDKDELDEADEMELAGSDLAVGDDDDERTFGADR